MATALRKAKSPKMTDSIPPMTSIAREPGVWSLPKAAMISRNPPANAQIGDEDSARRRDLDEGMYG